MRYESGVKVNTPDVTRYEPVPIFKLPESTVSVFVWALYEPEKMVILPELVWMAKFGNATLPVVSVTLCDDARAARGVGSIFCRTSPVVPDPSAPHVRRLRAPVSSDPVLMIASCI